MKKKVLIPIIAAVILSAVLFVPIPQGTCEDGGTRVYTALTYKIVAWNRIRGYGVYQKTSVYFGSDRNKSIDELWELECEQAKDVITNDFSDISLQESQESLDSTSKENSESENSSSEESGESVWLDKSKVEKTDGNSVLEIIITQIYNDHFYATYAAPSLYAIRLNGSISDEWCVGDKVICKCENVYVDDETCRVEADVLTVEKSNNDFPLVAYKPVIYLYPEEETKVSVKLDINGKLTCTYPKYTDSWEITASPDGTLTDEKGQKYNYLYWEGETDTEYDFSKGFCVKGEDTAEFLEYALEKAGLTRREANEFIVFWLPMMENNEYNIISFQSDIYTDAAKLETAPAPDTVIRVFMAWKPSETYIDIEEQQLTPPERKGFTVVEWGGTEAK